MLATLPQDSYLIWTHLKVLFITALTNIRLTGALGRGIRLPFDLILTNDRAQICSLLSDRFEPVAGRLETNALKSANAAVYSITERPKGELETAEAVRLVLIERLRRVQTFLQALWLVKDNAVNFELGFLEHPYRDRYVSTITSNLLAVHFSKIDGTGEVTAFDEAEARAARDIYANFFSDTYHTRQEDQGYVVPEDFTRIARVSHFIQVARTSTDLGIKVAHFVTCFEALFSTDTSELAHKLAERIALFLGQNADERTKIFKDVKAAYNVRSKVVHGDRIGPKIADQVPKLLERCDQLLRGSLEKILTSSDLWQIFLRTPAGLEDYFTSMVLGNRDTADTNGC